MLNLPRPRANAICRSLVVHFDPANPLKALVSARPASPASLPLDPASAPLLCAVWGEQPQSSAALRFHAIVAEATALLSTVA